MSEGGLGVNGDKGSKTNSIKRGLLQATFLVNEVAICIQYGPNKMSIQSLNAGSHILWYDGSKTMAY